MTCSLKGQRILFGVTGSIAAFKVAGWVHALAKEEARVTVVMTRAATRFVSSLTFDALSGNQVYTDMFSEGEDGSMAHITLPRAADLILIAPATAQTIARLAHGFADDLLSTAVLAATVPVVICPAMNSNMLAHAATQKNIQAVKKLGYIVIEPDSGLLACGDEGAGRLPEWGNVREILLGLHAPDDLAGQHVLITAGPTREPIDPVRYLSNRSSGKMGYALAVTARRRGATVTLVSGPVQLQPPAGVKCVSVLTAQEMHQAVMHYAEKSSVIVKAAAVADFRPENISRQKIKKAGAALTLPLTPTQDILAELGQNRRKGRLLVGFAAESCNHEAEGLRKLVDKNLDLVVVNDILGSRTGFDVDTNQVSLVTRDGIEQLQLMSKEETANRIWDRVVNLLPG